MIRDRLRRLGPPPRHLGPRLRLLLRLSDTKVQVCLFFGGVGLGMLLVALALEDLSGLVPALLFAAWVPLAFLIGRGTYLQRSHLLRDGLWAEGEVETAEHQSGGGDYRQAWQFRLGFVDAEGQPRRTSHHDEFRRKLARGTRVGLLYDAGAPHDTTPEGARPRVPSSRWPILELELPAAVVVTNEGAPAEPGWARFLWLLLPTLLGLGLPAVRLLRILAAG